MPVLGLDQLIEEYGHTTLSLVQCDGAPDARRAHRQVKRELNARLDRLAQEIGELAPGPAAHRMLALLAGDVPSHCWPGAGVHVTPHRGGGCILR